MRTRDDIQVQMEILASLFASPKVFTRLCQAVNVNPSRMQKYVSPMLAKELVVIRKEEGREVYAITDEGYGLYRYWLDIWRRLSL